MIMKVKSSLIYNKNHSCHFQHFLCEDRSTASESHFSYVDFLCHMHKVILLPIMFYSTLISFTLFSPMSDFLVNISYFRRYGRCCLEEMVSTISDHKSICFNQPCQHGHGLGLRIHQDRLGLQRQL